MLHYNVRFESDMHSGKCNICNIQLSLAAYKRLIECNLLCFTMLKHIALQKKCTGALNVLIGVGNKEANKS